MDSIPGKDRYFSLRCNVHTSSIAQLTSYQVVTIGSVPGGKVAAAASMKLTTDQEYRELLIHSHYVLMTWCLNKPILPTNFRFVLEKSVITQLVKKLPALRNLILYYHVLSLPFCPILSMFNLFPKLHTLLPEEPF
jgi:hypothetical protein